MAQPPEQNQSSTAKNARERQAAAEHALQERLKYFSRAPSQAARDKVLRSKSNEEAAGKNKPPSA